MVKIVKCKNLVINCQNSQKLSNVKKIVINCQNGQTMSKLSQSVKTCKKNQNRESLSKVVKMLVRSCFHNILIKWDQATWSSIELFWTAKNN